MTEGLFLTEQEAIDAAIKIDIKTMFITETHSDLLARNATDEEVIKFYYPLLETWETSTLYNIRFNGHILP